MRTPSRRDRAKAIREERQCSLHEAIAVENYEFTTAQIKAAKTLEDIKAILQTWLNKQFTWAIHRNEP